MRDLIITAGICVYMVAMLVIQTQALSAAVERKGLEHEAREKRVELRVDRKESEESEKNEESKTARLTGGYRPAVPAAQFNI